jgi:subtilisin family serine protease
MHDTAIVTDGYLALTDNSPHQPFVTNPYDLSLTIDRESPIATATIIESELTVAQWSGTSPEATVNSLETLSPTLAIIPDRVKAHLGEFPTNTQTPATSAPIRDELTGLEVDNLPPNRTGFPATGNPGNASDTTTEGFDPILGYGLVDAAAAVAAALGQPLDNVVADLGGNNWGLDLLNVPEVWDAGITGEGIVIAVIDSGVDITHPDLDANTWMNLDEIAGDGIDNDGNGYVDDLFGWNFEFGQPDAMVLPGTTNPGQDHGTHVAGIIAAENDGVGITGVAYDAQIMSLRLGDIGPGPGGASVFTNGGSLAEAIYYAVDNGADVINLSLGASPSPALAQALAYAANNNVFVVSSAGNDGDSSPGFPASYAVDDGASVGAINSNGQIANFSNQAGVDPDMQHVMAPGVDIYSTLPNGNYGFKSGTSMAAPYVAGVVALMLDANPNLTVDEIGTILTKTTAQSAGSTLA